MVDVLVTKEATCVVLKEAWTVNSGQTVWFGNDFRNCGGSLGDIPN